MNGRKKMPVPPECRKKKKRKYYAPDAELEGRFLAACDYLATSRPTAVNLFWALDRMRAAYGLSLIHI